jgi:hypothetical protein
MLAFSLYRSPFSTFYVFTPYSIVPKAFSPLCVLTLLVHLLISLRVDHHDRSGFSLSFFPCPFPISFVKSWRLLLVMVW